MALPQSNYLIAEDGDLQYAIAELMKAHVPDWGTNERTWKVKIARARGVDDALSHETLFEFMKASGLKVLGYAEIFARLGAPLDKTEEATT